MGDWSKGGPLGSLRKRAAREIKEHRKSNAALLSARPPLSMRVLRAFFRERSLGGFLALYVVIVVLLLILEITVAKICPSFVLPWTNSPHVGSLLKEVTSYFLGAQVVMVGLLFPVAVGLVTLIVQREDPSTKSSDIQVYYEESLAYRIGASGIALSIVLAAQLVWPAQFAAHRLGFETSSELSKVFLTAVHLLWLVINFAASWHFLFTSLSFIRPAERALLRRRFAANVSIPQDLSDRLAKALYAASGKSLLRDSNSSDGDDEAPSLLFGPALSDWGDIEVAEPKLSKKILHDVWMTPLGWAVRQWWKRCTTHVPINGQSRSGPALVFAPDLRRSLAEGGVICRRHHGVPMNALERFVVRQCFRFKRAKS